MKERPILFSAPMVRAILAGEKTQTRRTLKFPQPIDIIEQELQQGGFLALIERGDPPKILRIGSRLGVPGDRLWVRETWAQNEHPSDLGLKREDLPHTWDMAVAAAGQYRYRADPGAEIVADGREWRPSIFMPRAACRLVLEITEVRVQRLQEISEDDARAEGIDDGWLVREKLPSDGRRYAFRNLWDGINGKRAGAAWVDNPWAWCISFAVEEGFHNE